jgi:hypothetical protein
VLRRLAATGTAVLIAGPAAPETLALAGRACTVDRDRVTEIPVPAPDEAHRPVVARSTGGSAQ